jgi:hypothetical protein
MLRAGRFHVAHHFFISLPLKHLRPPARVPASIKILLHQTLHVLFFVRLCNAVRALGGVVEGRLIQFPQEAFLEK